MAKLLKKYELLLPLRPETLAALSAIGKKSTPVDTRFTRTRNRTATPAQYNFNPTFRPTQRLESWQVPNEINDDTLTMEFDDD